MKACNCTLSMENTGVACTPLIKVTKKLLEIPIYASDGVTRNYIPVDTTALDSAYFSALINNADSSLRMFPLPEMKSVEDTRGEAVTEDFADDTKIFIRTGIRAFAGMIVGKNAAPNLIGKLESGRCGEVGVYPVTADGNIVGIISADGTKLYPIRLDSESISATFIPATDKTIQKISVKFNFHPDESDSDLRMITKSELGTGVDPLLFKGLLDLVETATTPTTTGVIITLATEYGTPKNPVMAKGFLAANFTAYNVTAGSAIGLTGTGASVTETSDGVYAIVYKTADDPASTNMVRITANKAGYAITSKTFTTA